MSSLESFIEILKVWNFFGSSHLIIKEQAVLSSTTLPTWEKARTSLTCDIMRTDSFEEDDFNCKFFSVKDQFLDLDFRTPKPPFQYSSGDALRTTKIQEIAPSLDVGSSDITRKGVEDVYTSQHILTCGQLVSKPLTTSTSCSVQVQMMRPSFSRSKGTDKTKKGSSPRHLATDSSHEQSHASPVNSSSERLLKSSLAGPVNSSSLLKPSHSGPVNLATEIGPRNGPLINTGRAIMQSTGDHVSRKSAKHLEFKIQNIVQSSLPDSQNPQKNHEEFLNSSCQEGPAKVQQGNSSEKRATDRKKKSKESTGDATARKKAKPEVDMDELIAKVVNHHKRGEMRSLTVADLKCFLGAKKVKVGGTKEVLLQRVTALLGTTPSL